MPDTPGSLLMQYQYDALDRLISSTPAGQRRQDRHYQNSQFSTEIQGEIQLQIFQGMGELLAERQKGSVQQTSLLITDKPRTVL
jgi:YD repeat-containing protein